MQRKVSLRRYKIPDTILNGYKIWRFEDPQVWWILILAILG